MNHSNLLGPEISVLLPDITGVDRCNSRGDGPDDPDTEALTANIAVNGQLYPVTLRHGAVEPRYVVLVGVRRWRAIQRLAVTAAESLRVRARVFNGDDEAARAMSLAENFARRALHPLDEARGFARLAQTLSVERVARDFGVTKKFVRERLALAALAPKIAAAWRAGTLSEAAARALAVLPDAAAQEEAFARFSAPHLSFVLESPRELRARLAADAPSAKSGAALFVGEKSYRAAGGVILEDLFDDEARFVDGALLRRLDHDKRSETARFIQVSEGWGFAAVGDEPMECAVRPDWSDDEARRADVLENELAGLALDDPRYREAWDALDALKALGAKRATTAQERARLGVVVSIDGAGGLEIERGVRPAVGRLAEPPHNPAAGDVAGVADAGRTADDAGRLAEPPHNRAAARRAVFEPGVADIDPPVHPAARRIAESAATHALSAAAAASPALAAMLLLWRLTRGGACAPGFARSHFGPRGVRHPLAMRIARAGAIGEQLAIAAAAPANEKFAATLDCVAASIDLRGADEESLHAIITAACALVPDLSRAIAERFDYAGYFSAASRAVALAAIGECGGRAAEMAAGWRKDPQAAGEAALAARAALWLPDFLRPPGFSFARPADAGASSANIEAAE